MGSVEKSFTDKVICGLHIMPGKTSTSTSLKENLMAWMPVIVAGEMLVRLAGIVWFGWVLTMESRRL